MGALGRWRQRRNWKRLQSRQMKSAQRRSAKAVQARDKVNRAARRSQGRSSWAERLGIAVLVGVPLLILLPGIAIFANGLRQEITGCRVLQVVDGDTVTMLCPDKGLQRGRILGYDTAELRSRCLAEFALAWRATLALQWQILKAKRIETIVHGRDRYDRLLVRIQLDGRHVSSLMIEAGLARRYGGGERRSWCDI